MPAHRPAEPAEALPADLEPDRVGELVAWAASGVMALTGRADAAPLGPPAGFVTELRAIAHRLATDARALGGRVRLDPLALLAERAAVRGLTRQGSTSCGGTTRLLPVADGWIAASLSRPEDVELIPAWLRIDPPGDDAWEAVAGAVAARPGAEVVEWGRRLGLPLSVLAEPSTDPRLRRPEARPLPVREVRLRGHAPARTSLADVVVVDLTGLWAGPLCGRILAEAGAQVVKVESTGRPDGARRGPARFYDLLNGGKRSVALDFDRPAGRRALVGLLERADVVLEASRPRALEQLGIDAAALVAGGGPQVWVSITGHGRTGPARDWVAFGDDAAVAGGLVCWDGPQPCFCADAVADPLTGLVAASATLGVLRVGARWMLDVAMSRVARRLAGPTLPVGTPAPEVAPPRAHRPRARAAALGRDTEAVLRELGVR
ncbi:MAG: CoA transferase [Acidimicrobiia bacterium]